MNESQRDELLIRLDERTITIREISTKNEKHLADLNNKVVENARNIALLAGRTDNLERGLTVKFTKTQGIAGGVGISSIAGSVILLVGKSLGWW